MQIKFKRIHRGPSLNCVLSLSVAFIMTFEGAFAQAQTPCVEALVAGQPVVTLSSPATPKPDALDATTIEDLDVDGLESLLAPYLRTDFGRRRWAYMLRHPDRARAHELQTLVRYMADHLQDFGAVEGHFQQISDAENHLLDRFANLEKLDNNMGYEVLWTVYLWACYVGPTIGHLFFSLPAYASFLIAGQAWGASLGNVKRVAKLRERLRDYRFHLKTADLAAEALREVPNPIAQNLSAELAPPAPLKRTWRGWLRQTYDRLISGRHEATPFRTVTEGLKRMDRIIGTTVFGVPLELDLALIWDRFFISNYGLRRLHTKLVENKENMAALFSTLGDFEVYLALARFYDRHRDQTTFMKIDTEAAQPYIQVCGARPPLSAVADYHNTRPSDLDLNRERVELLAGDANHGALTRLKLYGQISLATLSGLPVFAESGGAMSANMIVAQLSAPRSLSGESPLKAEARRWAEIEARTHQDPYTLVLLTDPFTTAGDDRSLAIREQIVRELGARGNLAVISTKSQRLLAETWDMPGVALRQMQNYSAVPFSANDLKDVLDPAATWETLRAAGVDAEFVGGIQRNYERLRADRRPADVVTKRDRKIIKFPFGRSTARATDLEPESETADSRRAQN